MRKIVLAFVVAASFATVPAFAQGYVGAGFGSSTTTGFDSGNITGGNANKGLVKIYGGYNYTPNWGVEAQYSDFGKREISAGNVNIGSYKASQFSLVGTGTLPLTSGFSILAKIGASANRASGSTGVVGSDKATSLMFGIGAAYNIAPTLSLRAEYEDFGKIGKVGNSDVRIKGYSISLKYGF